MAFSKTILQYKTYKIPYRTITKPKETSDNPKKMRASKYPYLCRARKKKANSSAALVPPPLSLPPVIDAIAVATGMYSSNLSSNNIVAAKMFNKFPVIMACCIKRNAEDESARIGLAPAVTITRNEKVGLDEGFAK